MEPAEPGSGADNKPDDALVAAPDEAEALRPDDELEALYTCTPDTLSAPEASLDPDADAYAALNLEDAEKEILRQVARDEVEARLEDCGAEDVALASLYAECRRYEAIERERVSSILRGLRSQGAALREMMDAHRGAVRGCAGLLRPSVAGARALALSVAKGSRAIVHRAIRHMAVCTTVGSRARASVVDAASSVALRCGADVELQQTAAGLVAWFANVVCKQSSKALRDALLEAALELRRAEAGETDARDEFARPFATFAELDDDPKADAVFRLRRALRSARAAAAARAAEGAGAAALRVADAGRVAARDCARRAKGGAADGAAEPAEPAVVSAAQYELVLAIGRAAGLPERTRWSFGLCWLHGLLTPHGFERPGLPDEALAHCLGFVAGDGDVAAFVRLALVCRQFRDVSRGSGPRALAAAAGGVVVVEAARPRGGGDDDDAPLCGEGEGYARDASLAATLRWVARGGPKSLTFSSARPGPSRSLGAVFSIGAPRLRLLTALVVVRARGFDDGAAAAVAAGCEVLSSVRLDGTRVGDAGVAALAAGLRSTLATLAVVARGAASHLGDVGVAAVARVCAPRAPGGAAASLPAELAFLERRRDAGGCLTSLDLSRHGKLTDEGVLSVAGGLGRRLRHLVLNRCGNVTDLSPVAVADACADLESLGLEGCARVSDVGALALARHEALRRAAFGGTRAGPVGVSALLENCPRLRAAPGGGWRLADAAVLRDICARRAHFDAPLAYARVDVAVVDGATATLVAPRWDDRSGLCRLELDDAAGLRFPDGGGAAAPDRGDLRLLPPDDAPRDDAPRRYVRPGAPLATVDGLSLDGRDAFEDLAAAKRPPPLGVPTAAAAAAAALRAARPGARLGFLALTALQLAFQAFAAALRDLDDLPPPDAAALDSPALLRFLLDELAAGGGTGAPPPHGNVLLWDGAAVDVLAPLLVRAIDAVRDGSQERRRLHETIRQIELHPAS